MSLVSLAVQAIYVPSVPMPLVGLASLELGTLKALKACFNWGQLGA